MSSSGLKQRVEARDRLVVQAENGGLELHEQALGALQRGDTAQAVAAIHRNDQHVRTLAENLRIYQAELHAQADELAASQARTEELLGRFTALFSNMPVAAMLVGANGEVREVNTQAQTLLALRSGSSIRFLHRLLDAADYQHRVRPAFHEAQASGASAVDTVTFIAEDGRRFFGELHISALPAGRGERGQFACAVVDRTEHLNDLQALRESAEALRLSQGFLVDSAQLARIGGWEYEVEGGTLHWSPEMRLVFDITDDVPATLEATLSLCTPKSRASLWAGLEAAAKLGRAFQMELDMLSAAGRAMRISAVGHADAGGGAGTRVFGVFQDISNQFAAHRRIDDLTERMSVANDAGGIGVWDWNLTDDHLFFDDRMCGLLGLAEPPCANMRTALRHHVHPEDLSRFDAALQHSITHHEPLSVELRRVGIDGGSGPGTGTSTEAGGAEHWVHLAGRAQMDEASNTVRLVGCAWDSTPEHDAARLLAAKESAEFASRSKSAFLSRMSHELRTPLNAILGFSQLMRMEAEAGDLVLKPHRVVLIETAARHLLELINEVLDVSRVESGQLELRLLRFDLRDAVRECLPLVLGQAEAAGITITDQTASGPPLWVLGDRLRLKEVLINLLSNAVKYNAAQGRVDISARNLGEQVELTVADTGRGLDEKQLAGLFQPFNRLGAEALGVEGSGMGLFVSKRFVDLMGGSLNATSAPGQGTAFTLTLNAPAS